MLNLKKVIALVCVFALALSTVAFGATYTDVTEDSAYYEAVETLTKLAIVEGKGEGLFAPEDGVTRAEMAALIARIQGYGETAKTSANTGFTDVPANHWASGYIANAAGMGIINGYGDGTFGPEDPVLYEQAVKMVMATLGYTPYAEKNGGYPTGYLAAAQRYDVSLAVANAVAGTEANRGTIAQILVNAIDTPLMVQASWNTNGEVVYVIADGTRQGNYTTSYKTLMSENLGYVKIRGVVTENSTTWLNGEKEVNTDEEAFVTIAVADDYDTENKTFLERATDKFLVNGTDAEDYIGRSVIAYLKVNSKDNLELLSVAVDTNRNKTLTIGVDQLVGAVEGEKDKLEYIKDGADKATKITVSAPKAIYEEDEEGEEVIVDYEGGLSVVYNFSGEAVDGIDGLDALAGSLYGGEITFVDNDELPGYDVAIVELAATAVVDDVEDNYVAFKKDIELPVGGELSGILDDEDDEEVIVKVLKDGEEIEVAELNEWDVLSVLAAKKDANVIVAEVITDQVIGTITSTRNSRTSADNYDDETGKGKAYKVDDTWYDVATNRAGDALEIGLGGTFFIDKYGKIAAFSEDSALAGGAAANYGFILDVKEESEATTFGEPKAKVLILTGTGVEIMNLKNNAKLDGATIYTTAKDDEYDAEYAVEELAAGQVVRYTKSAAGELSTLSTAGYKDYFTGGMLDEAATEEFDAEDGDLGRFIEEDAIIFAIDMETPEDSKIVTLADFTDKEIYTVYGRYATAKANDDDIIVVDATDFAKAGVTTGLAVISGVGITSNDADEEVLSVSYLENGEELEALTTADVATDVAEDLTAGDIVKVKTMGGAISNIEIVWDFDDEMNLVAYNELTGEDETSVGGIAEAYNKDKGIITLDGATYNLSRKGVNKYIINVSAMGDVKISTTGSYKYVSLLYADNAGSYNYNKLIDNNGNELSGTYTVDEAKALTDRVYVRTYDDKVTDYVIVRGITGVSKVAAE